MAATPDAAGSDAGRKRARRQVWISLLAVGGCILTFPVWMTALMIVVSSLGYMGLHAQSNTARLEQSTLTIVPNPDGASAIFIVKPAQPIKRRKVFAHATLQSAGVLSLQSDPYPVLWEYPPQARPPAALTGTCFARIGSYAGPANTTIDVQHTGGAEIGIKVTLDITGLSQQVLEAIRRHEAAVALCYTSGQQHGKAFLLPIRVR